MIQLKALIFDVDGTLAETERDGHRITFNQAFAAAGLDWEWSVEQYGELLAVTGGKERIWSYLQQYQPNFEPPAADLSIKEWIAQLHAAKTTYYTELLRQGGIALRPGVLRLLTEAKEAGIRLAIATTTTPANVTALLEAALPGGLDWFEVIAAGDIVPAKKPAPDIYQYALQQLQLEPQDCLAFEDSEAGLKSAQQAGLTTVVTVNDYTRAQDFSGAAIVLNHLGEPDLPFEVIAGQADASTYFDLAFAKNLLNPMSH
jgi:HAD superfamily hydrolase (TIGR01509 family)